VIDAGLTNPMLRASCWTAEPLSLGELIDRTEALLLDLRALHSGFSHLHFVRAGDSRKPSAIADDVSNVRPWLLNEAWDRRALKRYTALDGQGRPTLTSVGIFSASFSNWEGFDRKFDVRLSSSIMHRGRYVAECVMKFPRKNNAEFTEGPLPLQLLEAVLRHWPIGYSDYTTTGLLEAVNRAEPREAWVGTRSIGWLTYTDDPQVAETLPASVVDVQRVGPGFCFRIGERMPSFENEKDVARLRAVREALRKAGKLYVWPEPA
jgi:hypothetical protein